MAENIIIAVVICILAFIIAYAFIPANKHRFIFAFIIFTSIAVRFIVVFYIYRNGTDTFGTDGLLYHKEGIDIMNQLSLGKSLFNLDYSYTLYTIIIGTIYYIAGINRYLASYFNIILALVSGLILLKIALNQKYSILNSYLICTCFLFFPNLILWTTDTRKEAILMLVCFICWLTVQKLIMTIHQRNNCLNNIVRVLFICLMMWVATLIRIYILIPIIVGIMLSLAILYRKSRLKRCLCAMAVIFFCGILLLVTTVYPLTENYHAINFPKNQDQNLADDVNGKFATILKIISEKNIPRSIISCLLLPYPLDMDITDISYSKNLQLIVQMDMIIWYICLLLILSGLYSAIKTRNSFLLGLLAFISVYILINAFIAENVADTVYRYRSTIVGLTILFIDGRILKGLLIQLGKLLINKPEEKLQTYAKYEVLSMLQNRRNLL